MVKALGKKDPQFLYKTGCENCAEELEYTMSDVTSRMYSDYAGAFGTYKYITCPVCNKETEI